QAEQARNEGYPDMAAMHFRRVGELAPGSKIQTTSEYDAAAALIAAEQWDDAIRQLLKFRRNHPKSPLMTDIRDKLAVSYMKSGRTDEAAREFESLSEVKSEQKDKREMLWLAAELYEKLEDRRARLRVYHRYIKYFSVPLEPAMEIRWKLAKLYEEESDYSQRDHWYRLLIEANDKAGGDSTPRTRFLAATAQLDMGDDLLEEFNNINLVEPLQENMRKKQQIMERLMTLYASVLDKQVAETTTNAAYHIAELQRRFGKALLESQRPAGLNGDEMEQYEMLLEEQAYPFEENALDIHESNVSRIRAGVYDMWTQRSLDSLSMLQPARYYKPELAEEMFDGR
ncbi:MAG: tetratricopeptide repeat protein, partial [Chromatiales bacterium]|nr:tetratricopeptide repeat protein [Chromatiales bacterium]